MKQLRLPVLLSIAAALITLGLKSAAYWLTGSVGLLSDALESLVNLFAAVTAMLSLWYAARPVDRSHTYGHEKIEFFSSGLEGTLIIVAAIGIVRLAIARLIEPQPLEELGVGTLVMCIAGAINFVVALVLLRVGKRHGSIVLEADGHHLMTDVLTSVGVLIGLALVAVTGRLWFDPAIALVVAANILWTGFRLIRRSFNGLMDASLTDEEQTELRQLIETHLEPGTTFHALRTRRGGTRRFADCHLLVPGAWSVQRAHDLCERIETAVRQAMSGTELTIHAEPIESPKSWQDSEMLRVENSD